jgi:tetratricopeptide (TPR) repeat protein
MAEPARAKSPVKAEIAGKRVVDYSKKYWWLAAIAVPLIVAVIGKYPFKTDTPVPGTTYIGSMTVIERQYQQYVGQPLTDTNVKRKFQQANELVAMSNFQDAAALVQEIAEKVPVPAVLNNLGVLYQGAGDQQLAKKAYEQALQKDLNYGPAKANLKALEELRTAPQPIVSVTDREHEPNNEILQANAIQLNTGIAAAIADSSDKDTFALKTFPKYRDWIEITVDNESTTLTPGIEVFNADKSSMGKTEASNAGANGKYYFVCQPDSSYYVHIVPIGYGQPGGAYRLLVKSRKAYDVYEPNDDIHHAAPIRLGNTIDANIMDPDDTDYYEFKTSKRGNVVVSVVNRSTTLIPGIEAFDSDFSSVGGDSAHTPGANHRYTFPSQANAVYYVQIKPTGYGQPAGDYSMTITEQ